VWVNSPGPAFALDLRVLVGDLARRRGEDLALAGFVTEEKISGPAL
jgi:hypothetical protein